MNTKTVSIKMPEAATADALGLDENEFLAVISTEDLDRDGEVVVAGAFEPLPERIVVEIDHASFTGDRSAIRSVVGSGRPFYVGRELMIRGTYASTEIAQEVRTLVQEGHVGRMSIAFSRIDVRPVDGVPHVFKGELLNVSFVTVPANDRSRVLASKSADADTTEETTDSSVDDEGVVGIVLGLDRPEHIEEAQVDEWTNAVRDFATGWTPQGKEQDPGQATDEDATDEAASDESAALRQRQRARAQAVAAMATPSNEPGE